MLQRRCLGPASGRDAIERARRRDAASRRGAAAAPRRPNAGRGEEVARTRRDADPARSASPARRALRLRAKCRALAAGIARGRGTRGRGAPSAALDRFAGGFGRYVFEPRGCVVNVWRPRARAPSVDGRENRLALFPRPPQKASLHRGSRSIRPARDPLNPGRRPIASTGENDATCRVRARRRRLPVRRFTPPGRSPLPPPLPRAPGRTRHGTTPLVRLCVRPRPSMTTPSTAPRRRSLAPASALARGSPRARFAARRTGAPRALRRARAVPTPVAARTRRATPSRAPVSVSRGARPGAAAAPPRRPAVSARASSSHASASASAPGGPPL